MLTMTDTAADAVKTMVSRLPETADGGVRISDDGVREGFALTLAATPEPNDTVVDTDGARVFLDATAAAALDGQVLDAQRGQDGSVSFSVTPQN